MIWESSQASDRGRIPPVEAAAPIARVVQGDGLFQERALRSQREGDPPHHSVGPVDVSDPDRGASVWVFDGPEIDRGNRHPVVRDGEVELDAERNPGPAKGNLRKFDRGIGVEHLLAVALVDATVEPSAEVRQNDDLQVLVLEIQRTPASNRFSIGQVFARGVRVSDETAGLEEIEGRIDVRGSFLVGRKLEGSFPDFDLTAEAFAELAANRPNATKARRSCLATAPIVPSTYILTTTEEILKKLTAEDAEKRRRETRSFSSASLCDLCGEILQHSTFSFPRRLPFLTTSPTAASTATAAACWSGRSCTECHYPGRWRTYPSGQPSGD